MRILFSVLFILSSFLGFGQRVTASSASKHTAADIIPPSIVITSVVSIDTSQVFLVTFTTSETALGFTTGDVTYSTGTVSAIGTLTSTYNNPQDPNFQKVWTLSCTSNLYNAATFSVSAGTFTDPSGNANLVSNTLTVPLGLPAWDTGTSWASYAMWRTKLASITSQTTTVNYYDGSVGAMKNEGSVSIGDGTIITCPVAGSVIQWTPSTNGYAVVTGSGNYLGPVYAPNGKIYFGGFNTNAIGVYDPSNNTFYQMASSIGALPNAAGQTAFTNGGTLCQVNGQAAIVWAPYGSGAFVCLYPTSALGSQANDTWYTFGTGDTNLSGQPYAGIIEGPNGKLITSPFGTVKIAEIDLTALVGGNLTSASISYPYPDVTPGGSGGCAGLRTGLDGLVYSSSYGRTNLLQIDVNAHTITYFGATQLSGVAASAWGSLNMDMRGHLWSFPQGESRSLDITTGASPSVTLTTCSTLSTYIGTSFTSDGRVFAPSFNATGGHGKFATVGTATVALDPRWYLSRFVNTY